MLGSYARDEAKEDSDIDLTILKIEKKIFFKRTKTIYFLEKQLNKKVDMGYFDSIRQVLKDDKKRDDLCLKELEELFLFDIVIATLRFNTM